jgi:hypothetical protein
MAKERKSEIIGNEYLLGDINKIVYKYARTDGELFLEYMNSDIETRYRGLNSMFSDQKTDYTDIVAHVCSKSDSDQKSEIDQKSGTDSKSRINGAVILSYMSPKSVREDLHLSLMACAIDNGEIDIVKNLVYILPVVSPYDPIVKKACLSGNQEIIDIFASILSRLPDPTSLDSIKSTFKAFNGYTEFDSITLLSNRAYAQLYNLGKSRIMSILREWTPVGFYLSKKH